MGRQYVEMRVTASVSRHNSEQDEIDDALWGELQEQIREIAGWAKYESIRVELI